jgi:transposase InsO family protein
LVVLAHHRRRVLHFNVTEHPTALWTRQQIIESFPEDTARRYLLRDRDKIYGEEFRQRIRSLGIEEVLSAPASPWQRAYVETLIGSIRRDCLDCVIILGERHLRASWNWPATLARASSGVQGLAPRGTGGGEKTSSQSEHLQAMGAPATWSVTMSVGIWSLT